jgi:hypothetical protein
MGCGFGEILDLTTIRAPLPLPRCTWSGTNGFLKVFFSSLVLLDRSRSLRLVLLALPVSFRLSLFSLLSLLPFLFFPYLCLLFFSSRQELVLFFQPILPQ